VVVIERCSPATNETGGSETVVDAATGAPKGTVDLGGDAGNVAYDPTADQMRRQRDPAHRRPEHLAGHRHRHCRPRS
jgi:hypothetical protein